MDNLRIMLHAMVFEDYAAFLKAKPVIDQAGGAFEVLEPPGFCEGLVAPVILVGTGAPLLLTELLRHKVRISGTFLHRPSHRDIPQGKAPDPRWREALGDLRITMARPSVSNPLKLRVEVRPARSLAMLIPIMARFIRGGTYRPAVPLLSFEEEHRLLTVSQDTIVLSRVDDMLDAWLMLRCMVELVLAAWDRREVLKPDAVPRQGVGAVEIFRRLPGRNCGRCGTCNCMEFAVALFTGKRTAEQCASLHEDSEREAWESLIWFLRTAGLDRSVSVTSKEARPEAAL